MSDGNEIPSRADSTGAVAPEAAFSETAFLLKYLETHDAACPLCRHNLRGLTVPRCPECGREIRLAVGMKEPYLRALVTMLVALCLAAGCGVLALVMLVTVFVQRGWPQFGPGDTLFAFLVYGSISSIIPAVASVIFYRRFLRLSPGAQLMLAVLAVFWDLILLSGLIAGVFNL